MIINFKDEKIRKLISNICNEHWLVAKQSDSNVGYLWYMYDSGSKKGNYKPFIFLSELNLLTKTGYITEEEKQNMLGMLLSIDEENAYMVAYSLITLRDKRIAEMGIWTPSNEKYVGITYSKDIVNPELFMKTL